MTKPDGASRDRPLFDPLFYTLAGSSALCVFLVAFREYRVDFPVDFRFLVWNLFLAWLPLVFSTMAHLLGRVVKGAALGGGLTVLGVCWLLLYPNAPYLTTDLVHLLHFTSYYSRVASDNLLMWFDIVLFFLFAWVGLLLGYLSTRHFHDIVVRYSGSRFAGWLFIAAVSYVGGFGVYLGRVVRLNSWDAVFSPFRLLDGVVQGLGRDAAVFTILFGTLMLIVYASLAAIGLRRRQSIH